MKEFEIENLKRQKLNLNSNKEVHKFKHKLKKGTEDVIKFCNKVSHSEIEFKENNDQNAINLALNSFTCLTNSIGMIIALYEK